MHAAQIADAAIGIFLEYRDSHGYDEDHARAAAIAEIVQGEKAKAELDKEAAVQALEEKILPGPYRTDPRDQNTYREEYRVEDRSNVVITDIFGGHETTVSIDEWLSWEPCDSHTAVAR